MLRIYICPKCYNFRMVSRKPDAICFHCGSQLDKCDLEYSEYVDMSEVQRKLYKDNYQKRIQLYHDKMEVLFQEHS